MTAEFYYYHNDFARYWAGISLSLIFRFEIYNIVLWDASNPKIVFWRSHCYLCSLSWAQMPWTDEGHSPERSIRSCLPAGSPLFPREWHRDEYCLLDEYLLDDFVIWMHQTSVFDLFSVHDRIHLNLELLWLSLLPLPGWTSSQAGAVHRCPQASRRTCGVRTCLVCCGMLLLPHQQVWAGASFHKQQSRCCEIDAQFNSFLVVSDNTLLSRRGDISRRPRASMHTSHLHGSVMDTPLLLRMKAIRYVHIGILHSLSWRTGYSFKIYFDLHVCFKISKPRVNGIYFVINWEAALTLSAQALAAYRTASRFFCGCHLPTLCIGNFTYPLWLRIASCFANLCHCHETSFYPYAIQTLHSRAFLFCLPCLFLISCMNHLIWSDPVKKVWNMPRLGTFRSLNNFLAMPPGSVHLILSLSTKLG